MSGGPTRRQILGAVGGAALAPRFAAAAGSRIEQLLGRMTLEEKAGQLTLMGGAPPGSAASAANPSAGTATDTQLEEIRAGAVGALFNGFGAEWTRRMQRTAVEESRLGIPLLFAADVIHGYKTIFPVPLAGAASWDPDLAEATARAAAIEAAAAGIAWSFAPMVDIARDARWGRGVEGSGEDPLLGSRFAAARVRGFQGRSLEDAGSLLATPKHFAAYGAGESGLDYNGADISLRTLREVYLPPFKAAIDAGALAIMAALNDLDGVPAIADPLLLTRILRGEWGYRGIVLSDFAADEDLIRAGIAADGRAAAKLAFLAGTDMSMASGLYRCHLPDLVRSGEVPAARLDESVRRVLRVKQSLGLFDDPYRRLSAGPVPPAVLAAHRALARDAAAKSIVLLRNEGVLPLDPQTPHLALIGPFAVGQNDLDGPWSLFQGDGDAVGLDTGIRSGLDPDSLLTAIRGCDVDQPIAGGIDAAQGAARAADVVLLALGESTQMSGEAQSRAEITLPSCQQALAEAVIALGKPVVVLLRTGRALALTGAVRDAPAILVTWFLGSETGHAVADVLFGRTSPGGRLPVSFPQRTGQEPFHYDHEPTGRPASDTDPGPFTAHFRELADTPLFAFGHGLAYSAVEYRSLVLERATLDWHGSVGASLTLANTGSRAVDEVVQLYIRARTSPVARPVRELKDFRKLRLGPGETATVGFRIDRRMLEYIDAEGTRRVAPGIFEIWAAPSATTGLMQPLELTARGHV